MPKRWLEVVKRSVAIIDFGGLLGKKNTHINRPRSTSALSGPLFGLRESRKYSCGLTGQILKLLEILQAKQKGHHSLVVSTQYKSQHP